jgi:nitrogen-specific signal transduction histidine kinase
LSKQKSALKVAPSGSSPPSAAEIRENQIQRAVIVGQLAGGILHDFNNILTVVTGTIEILSQAVADRPELVAIANLIDQAATRGAKLTSQLLAFTHGQPSLPREVDVDALIGEAARLLRATLGVQIEIVVTSADDLPLVLADPGQLTAALLSLAIVVREAMPEGSKLTFKTQAVHAKQGIVAGPGAVKRSDAVVIAVHVSGEKTAGEGKCVLGDLAMVEDFVERSGGHIKINRRAGDRALAEISLPAA